MGVPAKLVRIGNSRGVRIPKALIEAAGLGDELVLTVAGGGVVVSARSRRPRRASQAVGLRVRHDWDTRYANAGPADRDELMFPEPFDNAFDDKEWAWPGVSDDSTSTSSPSGRGSAAKSRRRGPA